MIDLDHLEALARAAQDSIDRCPPMSRPTVQWWADDVLALIERVRELEQQRAALAPYAADHFSGAPELDERWPGWRRWAEGGGA